VNARSSSCNKVSIISHSTGASETLIAAADVASFNSKVGVIAAVGPCLSVNAGDSWLPLNDIESVELIFNLLSKIPSMFGTNHLASIKSFCAENALNDMICSNFLIPNPADKDPYLKEFSVNYSRHVYQNSALTRFQPFSTGPDLIADPIRPYNLPEYLL
jgi:hypothetical protein